MTDATPRFKSWHAADLGATQRWIFNASPDLAEASGADLHQWCQPIINELCQGWGVALVRGLNPEDEASFKECFLAIGRCLGEEETTYGSLYEVKDLGESHLEKAIPVSQTKAETSLHTDSSRRDTHPRWVGLACVRQALAGGGSRLSSAVAVHDHLDETDPELLRRLKQSFFRDVVTPGVEERTAAIRENAFPVFLDAKDGPTLRYMRYWIEKGHEQMAQPLDPLDIQAFDVLDQTLNDPRFCHDFAMAPGDILFIDNHKTAHDREAYEDDPQVPRLMIRLWLNTI